MSTQFLEGILAAAEFPPAVTPIVVDAYAHRYADAMAHNACFAPFADRLLTQRLPIAARHSLISSGNAAALDAVLSTKERAEEVLGSIIRNWSLCSEDQLRFVNRRLTYKLATWVLYHSFFSTEVRDIVAKAHPRIPSYPLKGKPGARPIQYWAKEVDPNGTTSVPRFSLDAPRQRPWNKESMAAAVDVIGNEIRIAVRNGSPESPPLIKHLGTGRTGLSKRSWMIFLGLVEGDPQVPLQTVLDTAKTLARAER
jgi:hypothetical protein